MFQRQTQNGGMQIPIPISVCVPQLPSLPNSISNPLVNTDMSLPLFCLSSVTSECFILHSSSQCLYAVPTPSHRVPSPIWLRGLQKHPPPNSFLSPTLSATPLKTGDIGGKWVLQGCKWWFYTFNNMIKIKNKIVPQLIHQKKRAYPNISPHIHVLLMCLSTHICVWLYTYMNNQKRCPIFHIPG